MYKFVITGANGYIGTHLAWALRKKYPDCFIVGIDRKLNYKHMTLYNNFIQEDLKIDTLYILNYHNFDCVFYLAGESTVGFCEENPWKCYENNVGVLMRFLTKITNRKIPYFVFSSSAAVYGNKIYSMHSEKLDPDPINHYGKSKLLGENLIKYLPNTKSAILRYFNVAGRNVEADLWEQHEPETHLIPLIFKNKKVMIRGNDFYTRDKTAIRDYIHVMDVCEGTINAFEKIKETNTNIVSNIGTGIGTSVLEVVDVIQKITGLNIEKEYLPRNNSEPDILVADIRNMNNQLTFTPKYNIIDIINSMVGERNEK